MCSELFETLSYQKVLRNQMYAKCPWVFFGEKGEKIRDFSVSLRIRARQFCNLLYLRGVTAYNPSP
jgi:hypothetical protein